MKLLICILTSLATVFFAGAQDEEMFPVSFSVNQTVYLLGDSIHVRQEASSNSKSLTQLPIGTAVTVLERSKEVISLNGFSMPWYKVQYGKNKHGYIWGGKFAMNSFRSTQNPEIVFHFGLDKVIDGTAFFQIRVEKDHKEMQRISFEGFGNEFKPHECTDLGNKGLKALDDILYVSGYAQSCGDAGGSIVFFWANNTLYKVYRLSSFSDVPYFAYDTFIYPCDMEGKKDRILLKEEAGEHLFYEEGEDTSDKPEERIEKSEITVFRWDGTQLVKTK